MVNLIELKKVLESAPLKLKPSLYKRYVDDNLLVWSHGLEQLQKFVSHLNSFFDSNNLTMGLEANGKLPIREQEHK